MPRTKSKEPHRKPIQVKLSEAERRTMDKAAKAAGLQTSTWMRLACIAAAAK